MNTLKVLRVIMLRKSSFAKNLMYLSSNFYSSCFHRINLKNSNLNPVYREVHSTSVNKDKGLIIYSENDEEISDLESVPTESVRDLLFKESDDHIMQKLKLCSSLDEVFSTLKTFDIFIKPDHLSQAVLVLKDLRDIYMAYHNFSKTTSKDFSHNLLNNNEFVKLLSEINMAIDKFCLEHLTYLLTFLNKLGVPVEDDLMQKIAYKIKNNLNENFKLDICSRLFRIIFTEHSIRPYYIVMDLIPLVINYIDICDNVDDFRYLTICLNRLNNIISNETLEKYKNRVNYFLNTKLINSNYKTLLEIALFLNYPKWRSQNSLLISNVLLRMKDQINLLEVHELILIYEIFFKNQEPGELLNSIQRCCVKFLRQMEERETFSTEFYLKLFSAFVYFSPPLHRAKFRKDIRKNLKLCDDIDTFLLLRKIMSYVKISDRKTCEDYWNLSLKLVNEDNSVRDLVMMCSSYKTFNTDLMYFRSYKFEKKLLNSIEKFLKSDDLIFVSTWAVFLSFAFLYSKNIYLIENLLKKCEDNSFHLKPTDLLYLSESLSRIPENIVKTVFVDRLNKLLHDVTKKIVEIDDSDFTINNILLKACILRNDYDDFIVENLLYKFKELDYISSKMIDNIYVIFMDTKAIIPEVINKFTEYVVAHPDVVIGFNASRMLYMCYWLGYTPINDNKFFETITDIIIRDQERLSGLAFLQCGLALCFFSKLPASFIKQIFTVEFMDKLDSELANCYSKETYPHKVRRCLMQLNRAVCLEYPEYNVPWFHKKYIEDFFKQHVYHQKELQQHYSIKDYLSEVIGEKNFKENVITPYGYHIDFVVCLNSSRWVVSSESTSVSKKIALLIMKPHAYTNFYVHLKGRYQLKNRHLEIMGYEVSTLKFSEWSNLLYAGERLEYLKNLIWPDINVISTIRR